VHDLAPLSALGATTPRTDTIGPLSLAEAPDWALASLTARQGQAAACRAALAKLTGAEAPGIAGAAQGDVIGAFWIGPDAWMIEAPYTTHSDLAQRAADAAGQAASITDQSDAWVRFDLAGKGITRVMERLCNLDLERLRPGQARRSAIEHLSCFVIPRDDMLTLYGPRSGAQSLHHALMTAARSAL